MLLVGFGGTDMAVSGARSEWRTNQDDRRGQEGSGRRQRNLGAAFMMGVVWLAPWLLPPYALVC